MDQQHASLTTEGEQPLTEILNRWIVDNDLDSANQLRSIIYYHLKGIVKKQISTKAKKSASQNLIDQLPNTTSLLHDVLASLTPPSEIFDNREQFFLSLASFVRWMLLDDLKAKSTQKRTQEQAYITELLIQIDDPEPYHLFDAALTKLQTLSPRSYKVALLHYFLGYDIEDVKTELGINKSTVYNELSTAKAYLRTQC
ncbi:MAG: RNA polymerase sigma factor (TIGR02999 family) [Gammaproteobacteria bacterium]|jgi:RNA polymerase sigma factor (TIGR02999 family)